MTAFIKGISQLDYSAKKSRHFWALSLQSLVKPIVTVTCTSSLTIGMYDGGVLQSGIVVLWSCRSLPRSWRECKGAAARVNVLVLQKKGLCLTLLNFNE